MGYCFYREKKDKKNLTFVYHTLQDLVLQSFVRSDKIGCVQGDIAIAIFIMEGSILINSILFF